MRRLCETAGLGLVRHTSSVIAATSGAVAIGDLSVAAGVSSTHLAQRFKELIGVTPKRLARSYRFAATVLSINPAGPIDWADLAAGAGYFDQAHFGHEFRAFTGLTPTRYVEIRRLPARTSRPRIGQLAAAGRLISYKSDSSRHANLGAPQSRGEPRGQGGHVRLGVGGRLRRGRERPARTAVRLVVQR
ncbi:helix-turn-helix domain-containing protein [Streptomyces sp. NBC_01373]|uniref:helix-turn-helix domain-containing protein n=1 Tax=Streptomyces sp. NBC_01373 TaxID=2903843 RepID=UPI00225919D1|nr:helix-turn-helix domain-containing protein [Streptomyces sp. NBC_01373]MCX4704001.1 helix-turn-helix domain-containing protein [Streptomyces sp. NBC_01373]